MIWQMGGLWVEGGFGEQVSIPHIGIPFAQTRSQYTPLPPEHQINFVVSHSFHLPKYGDPGIL